MISYMVMGADFIEVDSFDSFEWLERADIIHVDTAREAKFLRDKALYGCALFYAPGYYVFDWGLDGFRPWESAEQLYTEYREIMEYLNH